MMQISVMKKQKQKLCLEMFFKDELLLIWSDTFLDFTFKLAKHASAMVKHFCLVHV